MKSKCRGNQRCWNGSINNIKTIKSCRQNIWNCSLILCLSNEGVPYCSQPQVPVWGESPPPGSGLPRREDKMDFSLRWISAGDEMAFSLTMHCTGQGDLSDTQGLPSLATALTTTAISQPCLLLPHVLKQGKDLHPWERCRVSPPCLQWLCPVCVGTLGWVLFPWPGRPWLLQDHPGSTDLFWMRCCYLSAERKMDHSH